MRSVAYRVSNLQHGHQQFYLTVKLHTRLSLYKLKGDLRGAVEPVCVLTNTVVMEVRVLKKCLALLLRIKDIPGSNLGLEISCGYYHYAQRNAGMLSQSRPRPLPPIACLIQKPSYHQTLCRLRYGQLC